MLRKHIKSLPVVPRLRATGTTFEHKRRLAVAKQTPGFHSQLTAYAMMSREQRYWRRMATLMKKKIATTTSRRLKKEYTSAHELCEQHFNDISALRETISASLTRLAMRRRSRE